MSFPRTQVAESLFDYFLIEVFDVLLARGKEGENEEVLSFSASLLAFSYIIIARILLFLTSYQALLYEIEQLGFRVGQKITEKYFFVRITTVFLNQQSYNG